MIRRPEAAGLKTVGLWVASRANFRFRGRLWIWSDSKSRLATKRPTRACPRRLRLSGGTPKETGPRAHALVDELETRDGMAVHAYLHRKEGSDSNADYWYRRSGRDHHRPSFEAEWTALVEALLATVPKP